MRVLIFCLLLTNIALAANIEIKASVEDVDIYIANDANATPNKIGKTPFKQDLEELLNTYVKSNTFIITLKKDGHYDYNVLFTKTADVDINLTVNMKVDDSIKKIKEYDTMMAGLFEAQKLIRSGNISDAIAQLDILEKKYKGFSIISELKATAYYLSKNVEQALSYYRKAFAENENNKDAYKMKVYLEKKLGVYSEL